MFESAKKNQKVTDLIISQIRDAVLSGQLKPGDRLASEKELIDQFGVSKATLREALRALEAMGLVQTRKGAAGGVYITEVNLQTTIHSMMNFLHFRSLSISEITMLRFMMEPVIVRIAAPKINQRELEQLESFVNRSEKDDASRMKKDIGFHRYLSRLTKNSMLILIINFVESLLNEIKELLELDDEFYKMVNVGHRRILDCLIKGDAVGASHAMAHDVVMVGKYLSGKLGEASFDPDQYGLDIDSFFQSATTGSRSDEHSGPGGMEAGVAAVLPPEQLAKAKILKALGSADLYLVVPHSPGSKDA